MNVSRPHQPGLWLFTWLLLCWTLLVNAGEGGTDDPLPSWAPGVTRQTLIDFVQRVTTPGGQDFVPVPQRIAVFDHDGTLWAEQPVYPQMAFVIDRVRTLAPQFPGWKNKQPFKAAIEGDTAALARGGSAALMQLAIATHAGLTTDQAAHLAEYWLTAARHPRFHRPYTELAYTPMLELLRFLRAHDFKTWIVSGGGTDFIRVFAERIYGIPPEQVIGSTLKTQFEISGDRAVLVHLPQIDFIDNRGGKPVAIQRAIGRRPILAFGNSDGDLPMLQWTSTAPGPHLSILIHHTDAAREWAYDRKSAVGTLDTALREAPRRGWLVVDMQRDWKRIFGFDS